MTRRARPARYGGATAFRLAARAARLVACTLSLATQAEPHATRTTSSTTRVAISSPPPSAIRRAAGAPEAARAVPAVLGCIESALQELMWATAALEQTSADLVEQDATTNRARGSGPSANGCTADLRTFSRRSPTASAPLPRRVRSPAGRSRASGAAPSGSQAPTVDCMSSGYSAPPAFPERGGRGGASPANRLGAT